jgi:hypothetical protein
MSANKVKTVKRLLSRTMAELAYELRTQIRPADGVKNVFPGKGQFVRGVPVYRSLVTVRYLLDSEDRRIRFGSSD